MSYTAPTTMLQAVNELLTAIGTTPVNTLEVAGLTDAAIAKDTVEATCREVQSHGWWFNTSRGIQLQVTTGEILVPSNYLRVSPAQGSTNWPAEPKQVALRNGKLYDLLTNLTTFDSPVRVDAVLLFAFDQLPESARRFITVRAARIFQTKVLGDDKLGVYTSVHEAEAFQALERDHLVSTPSSLYMERMLQRFERVRPNPIGFHKQQQEQQ